MNPQTKFVMFISGKPLDDIMILDLGMVYVTFL